MRKLFLDIHIYSSLLCAWYLVIYGLSTLSFTTTTSQMKRAQSGAGTSN